MASLRLCASADCGAILRHRVCAAPAESPSPACGRGRLLEARHAAVIYAPTRPRLCTMQAATYTAKGPAADVLRVQDIPAPVAGPGEVLVQVAWSGVNPSDVKSRAGTASPTMDHPLVVPHS